MFNYVGLDVLVENTAICVLDGAGQVGREIATASHADDIAAALAPFADRIEAIGLEAGPMSEFLVVGLKKHGMDAILMETRRVHAAWSTIPVKTDRKDAREWPRSWLSGDFSRFT